MSDPSREGCIVGTAWKRRGGGISFETRRRKERERPTQTPDEILQASLHPERHLSSRDDDGVSTCEETDEERSASASRRRRLKGDETRRTWNRNRNRHGSVMAEALERA